MKFEPKNLDFTLSPYTGMTRKSWIEAGIYMLKGVFCNLPSEDSPCVVPRYETEVTYPNRNTPAWKVQAEYFEGITRTFFIAAPLIKDNPEIEIGGIKLRDYYKKQILKSVTPGDPNFVRYYSDMNREYGGTDPIACYQQTVETCALVICLDECHEQIWDTYTKEEKDTIAKFLTDYAGGNTVPQNWRLFNMLDYAFLYKYGYPIDADKMRDHACAILSYYCGDGWYRDGFGFDYYSCWAFNVYTVIWNNWYGYKEEPYIAARFEENQNRLMQTYDRNFDADGFTNMWGRSCIYRFAATSAFPMNRLLKHSSVNPGLARRIASGSLLQFLSRDDFLWSRDENIPGVPTLGFYRSFLPLVQGYSCAESPYWMGKAFFCLDLPEDDPFWTAKEENGVWDKMGPKDVSVTVLNGPALAIANHAANGTTEMRTGKMVTDEDNIHGMWNYGKLVYSTKFPWEASTQPDIESQQYVLHDLTFDKVKRTNAVFWHGQEGDVLYRRAYFDYSNRGELCWKTALDLADFTVPCGLIRADRYRTYQRPWALTLGSFGFPDNGTQIIRREKRCGDLTFRAIILKGHDHTGHARQLAMTIFDGWTDLDTYSSTGTNPDSEKSVVIYAKTVRQKQYGYDKCILISQTITKGDLTDFTDDELFPVREIRYTDPQRCGGYGPVTLVLTDGRETVIDYSKIEGDIRR